MLQSLQCSLSKIPRCRPVFLQALTTRFLNPLTPIVKSKRDRFLFILSLSSDYYLLSSFYSITSHSFVASETNGSVRDVSLVGCGSNPDPRDSKFLRSLIMDSDSFNQNYNFRIKIKQIYCNRERSIFLAHNRT